MEKFVKGTIVVVPFPFSDLTGVKRRPVLILANLIGDDYLVCQITSVFDNDMYSIKLIESDFIEGKLSEDSLIRTNKLFTIDKVLIAYKIGEIEKGKLKVVLDMVVEILNA